MDFEHKRYSELDEFERRCMLLKIKELYMQKFPALLLRRMNFKLAIFKGYENTKCGDIITEFDKEKKADLICLFCPWDQTKQGVDFWADVAALFKRPAAATNTAIRELFKKHNVT